MDQRAAEGAVKIVTSFRARQQHFLLFHPHSHLVKYDHPISQVRKLRLEEVE